MRGGVLRSQHVQRLGDEGHHGKLIEGQIAEAERKWEHGKTGEIDRSQAM